MADANKLKKQLLDLTDLYENEKGRADLAQQTLSEFYRREPLVNLMWSEILLLRKLLETQYGKSAAVLDLPQQRATDRHKPTALSFRDKLTTATLKWMNDEGKTIDQALANSGQSPTTTLKQQGDQRQAPLGGGADVVSAQLQQAQQRIAQLEGQVGQMQSQYSQEIARLQSSGGAASSQTLNLHTPVANSNPTSESGSPPPPPPEDVGVPAAPPQEGGAPVSSATGSAIPQAPVLPGFIGKAGGAGGAGAAASSGGGGGSSTVPGTSIPLPPVLPGFTAKYPGQGQAAASSSGPAVAAVAAPVVDPGPQPTKPAIKPGKKMKALHWKPIITGDNNKQSAAAKSSVWAQIDKIYQNAVREIPVGQFEEMFTSAPPKTKAPAAGDAERAAKEANKPQRLFDANRHNQLAIMLNKMPPLPELKQALIRLDKTVLKPEQIESLHKNMFTTEDVDLVKGSELPKEKLLPPEQFILEMSTIPQLAARIECWRFAQVFDDEYISVVRPLARLETTCQEICSSGTLRQFLTYILVVGNHLNGGTARGRADGFDIDSLSKLFRIRDAAGTGTLMEYVLDFLKNKFGSGVVENLRQELSTLTEARSTSLRVIATDAKKLLGKINLTMKMQSLVLAQNIPGDQFEKVLAPFTADAEHKVKALDARATTALKAFGDCVKYLEPHLEKDEIDKVQSEEWFALLEEFVSGVVKCQGDQVRRAEAAEREAKAAANFAALQAKAGKKPGVDGGAGPAPQQELGENGFPKLRPAGQRPPMGAPGDAIDPQNELQGGFPKLRPAGQRPPMGAPGDAIDPQNELQGGFPKLRPAGQRPPMAAPGPDPQNELQGGFPKLRPAAQRPPMDAPGSDPQNELQAGFPKLRKTGGPEGNKAAQPDQSPDTAFAIPKLRATPKDEKMKVQDAPASEFENVKRPTAKSNIFLKAQNIVPAGAKAQQAAQAKKQEQLPAPIEDEAFFDSLGLPPPPPPDSD